MVVVVKFGEKMADTVYGVCKKKWLEGELGRLTKRNFNFLKREKRRFS